MALGGMKLRLRASMPTQKLKMFSQDSSLRTAYKDMPQPPDMLGGFVQKFATGGKVQGGTPGKDSVLGLLTPGEVVIPTDLVEKLEKAFSTVEGTKSVLEGGLGTPKDIEFYRKATAELATAIEVLGTEMKNAGVESRARLGPQVIQLRGRMNALGESTEKTKKPIEELFSKILGPARFVAIQTGLKNMQDGVGKLGTGASNAFGKMGGDQVRSVVDRIREVRMQLGLGAEDAATFTSAISDQSDLLGTSFAKSMEGAEALLAVGLKDRDQLIRQSPLLARANRLTGASFDSLANSAFRFSSDLGGSDDQFQSIINSIDAMKNSASLAVNVPALMETLQGVMSNSLLKKEGPENLQNITNSMLSLRAAAESVWAGDSGIEKIFGDALAGNLESLKKVHRLTDGAIVTQEDLATAMRSRRGLLGVFDQMEQAISRMDDPTVLRQFAESVDLDPNLLKRMSDFNGALDTAVETTEPFDQVGTSMDRAAESINKITTAAERLNNKIANMIGGSGALQTFIEFVDEVPIVALAATASLGGNLLKNVFSLGKGLFFAGRGALAMTTNMMASGPAASTALASIGKLGPAILRVAGPLAIIGAGVAVVTTKLLELDQGVKELEATKERLHKDGEAVPGAGSAIRSAQQQINKLRRLEKQQGFLSDSQQAWITRLESQIASTKSDIRASAQPRADVQVTQPSAAPSITKESVAETMKIVAEMRAGSETDMSETNDLLRKLVEEAQRPAQQGPSPAQVVAPTRTTDSALQSIASFGV